MKTKSTKILLALLSFELLTSSCKTANSSLKDDSDIPLPAQPIELEDKAPHLSNSLIDVISYDVDMTFPSFGNILVDVKADIKIKLLSKAGNVKLHFNKDAISIQSIKIEDKAVSYKTLQGKQGNHGLNGDVLYIELGQDLDSGSETLVALKYQLKPNIDGDRGLVFKQNFESSPIFNTRNWPYYTRFWLPSNDHPADTALFNAKLRVPQDAVAAANGRLVKGTPEVGDGVQSDGLRLFRWEQPTPIPVSGINVVVGKLDIIKSTTCFDTSTINADLKGCSSAQFKLPTSFYIQPGNSQRAQFLAAAKSGAESLAFFSSLLAPYPYEKLGFVTAPHPFNMESVSLIVMVSPEATVHEVAHHWWGNTVYFGHWGDFWISEGFTTYFTGLYDEFVTGTNTACLQTTDILNAKSDTDPLAIFNNTPYCKGAAALADLRARLGQAAGFPATDRRERDLFFALSRKLFLDFRYKRLSTELLVSWLNDNIISVANSQGASITEGPKNAMLAAWTSQWFEPF